MWDEITYPFPNFNGTIVEKKDPYTKVANALGRQKNRPAQYWPILVNTAPAWTLVLGLHGDFGYDPRTMIVNCGIILRVW